MHTQLTFELASSDGQIPAVYQRALQLGKNKELATTLAERRLKISRENFQHLYELLSLDSIAAVLYYALQFLFSCCINLDQYGQLVVLGHEVMQLFLEEVDEFGPQHFARLYQSVPCWFVRYASGSCAYLQSSYFPEVQTELMQSMRETATKLPQCFDRMLHTYRLENMAKIGKALL